MQFKMRSPLVYPLSDRIRMFNSSLLSITFFWLAERVKNQVGGASALQELCALTPVSVKKEELTTDEEMKKLTTVFKQYKKLDNWREVVLLN